MSKEKINISGVQGDVIGVKVSGQGNVVGKNITVSGSININSKELEKVPDRYAGSLKEFTENINKELTSNNIEPEKVQPVQESINELTKEIQELPPVEEIPTTKKKKIGAKLAAVAEGILKLLPKTAQTIAAFTPLAPFSELIGEGVEALVKGIQKEV